MDLIEQHISAQRHPWELARFVVIKQLVKEHIEIFENKNLLDLGCGDLYFLENFRKWQPSANYFAVDTAFKDDYINSKKESPIKVYKDLQQLPANEGFEFDIIFLMDVVEHIENDISFMRELTEKKYVSKNTLFVITVPAYQGLFSRHDRFLKHFRRYSNTSIEKVTETAGLKTIEKGYFFISLLLPRYVELIKEKLLGEDPSSYGTGLSNWNKNNFITQVLKYSLILDFRLHKLLKRIGIKSPGLSNYILCKKPA